MIHSLHTYRFSKPGKCFLLLLFIGCFGSFKSIRAQWSNNSTINNTIAVAAAGDYKNEPRIISDGAGGAIIAWYDNRNGIFNADIFVQRISAAGAVQWTVNGAAVSTAANDQYLPSLVSDGAGGAIITWQDFRNGTSNPDIYAQRVNASGSPQWTANGVIISAAANEQFPPSIVADGAGGAIITWQDQRNTSNSDIYAQRINASGSVQWTPDGLLISGASNSQGAPNIASDGGNGAIITWQDFRSNTNSDIYAQRIDGSGNIQWIGDGIVISNAGNDQYFPTIIADGANGAIITWQDFRSGIADIYAQRVNNAGSVQWTANGVAVCTASDYQYNPILASDGANGAIVTWYDFRNSNLDIFAQRVNAAGLVQWTPNGVAIVTTPEEQKEPAIIADGAGGAIITWQDSRSGAGDVFAQRINASGSVQWNSNGVAIGNSTARDENKPRLVSDGANGAIITWYAYDIPNYSKSDIFAQKVNANGSLDNGSSPCPALLTLASPSDDYSSGAITKQANAASGTIQATNVISGSSNVTYEAKTTELKPGFRAENGVVFKVQIGGCN
ncbi:MAG: hypothetical protein U0X91_17620 [Spirosomataceae bacterium]